MPLRLKEEAWFELYKAALAGASSDPALSAAEIASAAKVIANKAETTVAARCPSLIDIERSAEPKPEKVELEQWWYARCRAKDTPIIEWLDFPGMVVSVASNGNITMLDGAVERIIVVSDVSDRLMRYLGKS